MYTRTTYGYATPDTRTHSTGTSTPMHKHTFTHTLPPHLHQCPMSPPATHLLCPDSSRMFPPVCTRSCSPGTPPSFWPHGTGTPSPPRRSCRQGPTSRPRTRYTRTGGTLCRYWRRGGKGLKMCVDTSCLCLDLCVGYCECLCTYMCMCVCVVDA